MGIITSKRKVESSSKSGTCNDAKYDKLVQDESTITCHESDSCVLGQVETSDQLETSIASDYKDQQIDKQTVNCSRPSRSSTGQQTSNNIQGNQTGGHVSRFSIPVESKSLLENPLLKRASEESGKLKPVNPFRIGKDKDKQRIELFETGLLNPHNRAGIVRHEVNPEEEHIISELKGIGIISDPELEKRKKKEEVKLQSLGQVSEITEIPFESESLEENVHLLAGLSDVSVDNSSEKKDDCVIPDAKMTNEVGDNIALKMINMDVM